MSTGSGGDAAKRRLPLLVVFLTLAIDLVGFGIVMPLLPNFGARYGVSEVVVAALLASFSAVQFVLVPIWGRLSDRIGRRPVLLVGLAGSCASYFLFAVADSIELLFVSRVLAGAFGANIATAQAYVADVLPPEKRSQGMGMVGAAMGIGFVLGPVIGGMTVDESHAAPGLIASALSLGAFALALARLPESLRKDADAAPAAERRGWLSPSAIAAAVKRPGLGPLLLLGVLTTFSWSSLEATLARFGTLAHRFTQKEVNVTFFVLALALTLMQGMVVRRYGPRIGERRMLLSGAALLFAGYLFLPFAPPWAALVVVLVGLAAGVGLANPAISSLVSRRAGAGEQGGTLGILQSLASLCRVVGPMWGGTMLESFGPPAPALTSAAIMLAALLVAALLVQPAPEATGSRGLTGGPIPG